MGVGAGVGVAVGGLIFPGIGFFGGGTGIGNGDSLGVGVGTGVGVLLGGGIGLGVGVAVGLGGIGVVVGVGLGVEFGGGTGIGVWVGGGDGSGVVKPGEVILWATVVRVIKALELKSFATTLIIVVKNNAENKLNFGMESVANQLCPYELISIYLVPALTFSSLPTVCNLP